MSDNQICYFHNDKVAIDSCERCHKLICQADKKKAVRSMLPFPTFLKGSNPSYVLCPPCYFENVEKNVAKYDKKKIDSLFKKSMIFLLIPLIFLAVSFTIPSEKTRLSFMFSSLILGPVLIGILLFNKRIFINISKKAIEEFDDIQEDKKKFYRNLEQ